MKLSYESHVSPYTSVAAKRVVITLLLYSIGFYTSVVGMSGSVNRRSCEVMRYQGAGLGGV
jgi:hypothetical protein